MGQISCPEKSVRNYHYSLCNSPKHSSSHLTCTLFARSFHNCILSKVTLGNDKNSCHMGFQITARLLGVYIKQPNVPSFIQVMVSFLINVTDNVYEKTLRLTD